MQLESACLSCTKVLVLYLDTNLVNLLAVVLV